jgi:hypothetical protein
MFATRKAKAAPAASKSTPAPAPARLPIEPVPVSVESLLDELKVFRRDLADTGAKIAENYKAGKPDPDDLVLSRFHIERMIESREKEILQRAGAEAEARYVADKDNWRELARQRALTIVALRRLNRKIEATYRSYCIADGSPSSIEAHLTAYGPVGVAPFSFQLFGFRGSPGAAGRAAETYLQECVSHGIITAKECSDD